MESHSFFQLCSLRQSHHDHRKFHCKCVFHLLSHSFQPASHVYQHQPLGGIQTPSQKVTQGSCTRVSASPQERPSPLPISKNERPKACVPLECCDDSWGFSQTGQPLCYQRRLHPLIKRFVTPSIPRKLLGSQSHPKALVHLLTQRLLVSPALRDLFILHYKAWTICQYYTKTKTWYKSFGITILLLALLLINQKSMNAQLVKKTKEKKT